VYGVRNYQKAPYCSNAGHWHVHHQPALPRHHFGEVQGKAVGDVKPESEVPCHRGPGCIAGGERAEPVCLFLEQLQAAVQRPVEGFFLDPDHVFDVVLSGANLGKHVAHRIHQHI
jgi:hypothetical protein